MKKTGFNKQYNLWYRKSLAFAKSYVQDEMVAEDLVCDSLVKLWQLTREKEQENPEAILLTILKNKALDYLKHEAIRKSVEETLAEAYRNELNLRISTLEACNPDDIFLSEIKGIIRKTLDTLPEQTRRIFKMSRFGGYSVKEIALKHGITPKAVEYHITRSLKLLREKLKDYL
ncbi:MAG: RNA polymerase sigma-70 factor [Tannerella sp.]|jgi:RNA polymerase sigma-70 factor (ECF subfamily)|nr:RNA polymerase sigma-70 factor [Tannerella sp.]